MKKRVQITIDLSSFFHLLSFFFLILFLLTKKLINNPIDIKVNVHKNPKVS